jgi:ribosomal protein S18 acetylase RimI-like enzyme
MSKVTTKPYSDATHRDRVVALWGDVFGYDAPHNKPSLVIDKKIKEQDNLFLVAMADDSVIGTVMAGYDGHRGWIYSVAVAPAHRHRKVGSSLVSAAERSLMEKGCLKINLQIMEGNEGVAAFYSSLGYAVEKRVSMGERIHENIPAS